MSGRRLSRDQIERGLALREEGLSCAVIGRILGCSAGTISWHCLKEGADPPGAEPIDPIWRGAMIAVRNGRPVRRFSPEEDRRLLAFETDGLSATEIGRALDRTPNSVRGRLMTLARHEERAAGRRADFAGEKS